MVPQNLISSIAFWNAKENQTFRQSYCANNDAVAILCRRDRFLPFILKHATGTTPNFIYLVQQDGERAINLATLIGDTTEDIGDYAYTYNLGQVDINQATSVVQYSADGDAWDVFGSTTWGNWICEGGKYYIEISVGGERWRSELLVISDFPELGAGDGQLKHTRIQAANNCAIGDIPPSIMEQKLFIEGPPDDPDYITEKEVKTDGQEEETSLWVKVSKRYKITFLAIETVCDWLATVPMYSTILVTDPYGWQVPVKNVEVEISWPEEHGGCLAQVEFSYEITYISGTGCC